MQREPGPDPRDPDEHVPVGIDVSRAHSARMYDYYLLRHEAPLYRAGVRDLRRWAVAAA